MNSSRLLFLLLCFLLPGTPSGCKSQQPSHLVEKFLSNRLQVLSRPDYVTSYRVASDATAREDQLHVGGFPVLAQGPKLDEEQTARICEIVQNEESYDFHGAKLGSKFRPEAGLRFVLREAAVDVLLSFSGNEWRFYYQGHYVVEDFDSVRSELVTLVKQLFLDDLDIQALTPQG